MRKCVHGSEAIRVTLPMGIANLPAFLSRVKLAQRTG